MTSAEMRSAELELDILRGGIALFYSRMSDASQGRGPICCISSHKSPDPDPFPLEEKWCQQRHLLQQTVDMYLSAKKQVLPRSAERSIDGSVERWR